MLAMARVMVGRPKVLLINEPSEGLAPVIVADIYSIIDENASRPPGVLAEQNLNQALQICGRFIAIDRGRIVLKGRGQDAGDRMHWSKRCPSRASEM